MSSARPTPGNTILAGAVRNLLIPCGEDSYGPEGPRKDGTHVFPPNSLLT